MTFEYTYIIYLFTIYFNLTEINNKFSLKLTLDFIIRLYS